MTVAELIKALSEFPADMRVTLYDPDTSWLLPIKIEKLDADGVDRKVDFVGITSRYSETVEGHGPPIF